MIEQLLVQQLESPSGTGRVEPRSKRQPDSPRPQRTGYQQAATHSFSLAVLAGHVEQSEHQDVDMTVNAGCTRQSGVG